MTKILIKRLSKEVPLPKYETKGASGMDLSANISSSINIDPGNKEIIPTGLAVSVPEGFSYSSDNNNDWLTEEQLMEIT